MYMYRMYMIEQSLFTGFDYLENVFSSINFDYNLSQILLSMLAILQRCSDVLEYAYISMVTGATFSVSGCTV